MKIPKMILFDYGQTLIAEQKFDGVKGTDAVLQYATRNKYHLSAEQVQAKANEIKQFPIENGRYIVFLFHTDEFLGEVTSSEEQQIMKVLRKNGEIVEVNFEEKEGKQAFWHTSAHVLAQAVKRLYSETKCAIGSAIENGFYYNFQFEFSFSEDHLKTIEAEMRKIVRESLSLQVYEKSKEEALSFMENADETYKIELIQELNDTEQISFYKQGEYEEFCAGPHISNVCQIKAVKLLNLIFI